MGWGLLRGSAGLGLAALMALSGDAAAQSMLGSQPATPPARPAEAARPATPPAAATTPAPARPQAAPPAASTPGATTPAPARPQAAPPAASTPGATQQPRPRPPQQQQQQQGQQQRRPQGQQQQQQRRPVTPPAAAPAATPPAAAAPPPPEPPIPPRGAVTNLPTPRFAALRSDRVNLRVGPDTRFPIEWRYERRDLPVMIIREHDQWRRIRDVDGTEGWVHQSNLTPGRRTFLVRQIEGGDVPLRRRGDAESPVAARLRPGVIGRLRACEAGSAFCEVQAGEARGFVARTHIFGALADEEFRQ